MWISLKRGGNPRRQFIGLTLLITLVSFLYHLRKAFDATLSGIADVRPEETFFSYLFSHVYNIDYIFNNFFFVFCIAFIPLVIHFHLWPPVGRYIKKKLMRYKARYKDRLYHKSLLKAYNLRESGVLSETAYEKRVQEIKES